MRVVLACFVLALAVGTLIEPSKGRLFSRLGDGRKVERMFRGVNVVFKNYPYHPKLDKFDPQLSFVEEDAKFLKKYGFNVVRLGVMWAGVMPTRGQINETYLETMKGIAELLWRYDIYTIIDLHQDLLTERLCGEGIPDWLFDDLDIHPAAPFPSPAFDPITPNPSGHIDYDKCIENPFGAYYFSFAQADAWEAFWTNQGGSLDHLRDFWTAVATTFKGKDYLLAYEILNEPFPGNFFKNPKLVLDPGYADKKHLIPAYDYIIPAIRKIDSTTPIMIEPFVVEVLPSGLEAEDFERYSPAILSYHVYANSKVDHGRPMDRRIADIEEAELFAARMVDKKRCGVAAVLTEFGAVQNDTISTNDIDYVTELANFHLSSRLYWAYKGFHDPTTMAGLYGTLEGFWDDKGLLQTNKLFHLSEPYPDQTSGTISQLNFDRELNTFTMKYVPDCSMSDIPTKIWFSTDLYGTPYIETSFVDGKVSTAVSNDFVTVSHSCSTASPAAITVVISF